MIGMPIRALLYAYRNSYHETHAIRQGVAVCRGVVYVCDGNTSTLRAFDAVNMTSIAAELQVEDCGPLACVDTL